jgi:putative membrane protein
MKHAALAALLTVPVLWSAAPAPAQAQAQTAPLPTAEFVDKAAVGNMFEIQSSKLVIDKGQGIPNDLQQFAQRMMKEHTDVGQKLKTLAKTAKVPESLDQKHADMLKKLAAAQGKEAARTYADLQVQSHQESVALFERYAATGQDAELKGFAQQTLPALKQHLEAIRKLQGSMS